MSFEISDNLTEAPAPAAPLLSTKPHISPSQINTFTKCGEMWRRRYILKQRIPPGISMIKGTSVHKGAEFNYKQKIKTHEDLKSKEIVDFSVAAFETTLQKDGLVLTPEDEAIGRIKVIDEAKDSAARLAQLYADESAPHYQPMEVELKARIVLPSSSHDLLSIADMVDDQDNIVEYKTGKRWDQAKADHDVQLTFQAATFQAFTGRPAANIVVENLVDNKKPVRNVVSTSRDTEDFAAMIARINAVLDAINKGVYPPANDGAWWCAPNWCGYFGSCDYVRKRR